MMGETETMPRAKLLHAAISLLLVLVACEPEGRVKVEPGNPPGFRLEESFPGGDAKAGFASGVRVATTTRNATMWWVEGPRRQFDIPIIYGQLPDGWVILVAPQSLEAGQEYYVEIFGGTGLDGTARFHVDQDHEAGK